jgi:hypothetical protein
MEGGLSPTQDDLRFTPTPLLWHVGLSLGCCLQMLRASGVGHDDTTTESEACVWLKQAHCTRIGLAAATTTILPVNSTLSDFSVRYETL